ncbi:uncharacterized protein LTR77_010418 [Saxophila tyrrhenica]|uniref:TauD/TfdA-like domain-containing protein n=1 Tax=Saxophila tyrrhenica TaxID=1690608 RepID=A0AAV9NVD3_9PEZI|nr:hypothetical protein LTR77_010418 [Saxophila tyrrhenica]
MSSTTTLTEQPTTNGVKPAMNGEHSTTSGEHFETNGAATTSNHREPMKLSGALDGIKSFDVTPMIGREFPTASLKEWLYSPNSDELIRDLAITISRRGVVFFRAQDGMTNEDQKRLAQKIGELAGKPATSKLHIHPFSNFNGTPEDKDNQISVISNNGFKGPYKPSAALEIKQTQKDGWHSDITFEKVPSDYCILRLTEVPETGGDTMWASGYEVYDRISPAYQQFLEKLTATYAQPVFQRGANGAASNLYTDERGAPENVGDGLTAIHPVVRTNPVTGWKSIYPIGYHARRINEVSEDESRHLLDWFTRLVVENHDLQVRHRWQNKNDVAIWDNRSVYHTPTFDTEAPRTGHRAVSLGERPYLDKGSCGRRAGLKAEGAMW